MSMELKKIPLGQRLRRRQHIETARLQDMIVEVFYQFFPEGVIHGGTAIWRCYSGSRFSEDIDVYIDRDTEKLEQMFTRLSAVGFHISKKRIKHNSLYSKLSFNGMEVRFEAVFRKVGGTVMEYETYEGTLLNVYTLLPEELVKEKVAACLGRKKIRDLYDIFFLLRHVKNPQEVRPALNELLAKFSPPPDENELKVMVLYGVAPKTDDMIGYIRRWLK
jgi:predicted nucleotidyltransferase component of viral defense system